MGTDHFHHINFVQTGAGAPVILVHGVAASLNDWNALVPALTAAGYHSYALDLLGHGDSAKLEHLEDYHADNMFAHFNAWIEALALEQAPVIIGHSFGSYLAMEYALSHPGGVRALVLSAPFYTLEQLSPLLQRVYRRGLIKAQLFRLTPSWLIRFMVDLTSISLTSGRGMAFVLSDTIRVQTTADYRRAAPGIFKLPGTLRSLTPCLGQISPPALVVYGTHDLTLRQRFFPALVQALPNARGAAIQGGGHVIHQSHAAQFNQLVLEFLKTVA